MKWYTCAPVRFEGGDEFFARDSGLLCKGFQSLGIESKAIMPGPGFPTDDNVNLIRTEYQNLESCEWWRSLNIDGLVLYGWGSGKYWKIAKAISEAGIPFVSHMDTAGLFSPLNGPLDYIFSLWRVEKGTKKNAIRSKIYSLARIAYGFSAGLIINDLPRARHLNYATWVAGVSPIATQRIKRACKAYGGEYLSKRVITIPHPVAPYMAFDSLIEKKSKILAIGRWNDPQKDVDLLIDVASEVLDKHPGVTFEIFGRITDRLENFRLSLEAGRQSRFNLHGIVSNMTLSRYMVEAQILLCTSVYESFHIASGEALCSGNSIVGPDIPEIPSLNWFCAEGHGTVAKRNYCAISESILKELNKWENKDHNPAEISAIWRNRLYPSEVALQILKTAGVSLT